MTLPRRFPAIVVALLCAALLAPAAAPGSTAPAGAPSADATAAAKKKKKAKKACKKVVKKVNGKRKKVCKKKKARSRARDDGGGTPAPKPPVPAPPGPTPPTPPTPPAPVPPPPPPPVDPEQYRADDVGRQLIAGRDILLERATGGAVMEYTRIYMRKDGSFKLAKSSWNMVSGESCDSVTRGTWGFNRAYKPPEGGVLLVLDITINGTPGSDLFWVVDQSTVKVGKDFVPYTINDYMGEPC